MAPMKRTASGGLKSRCESVRKALEQAEFEGRVKKMLSASIGFTVGVPQADRHPFNERFVAMIEQVLNSEQARLKNEVTQKKAAFEELSPTKQTREAALEQAKAHAAEASAALDAAKQAVTEITADVKAAGEKIKETKSEEKAGNEELDAVEAKKAKLQNAMSAFVALTDGSAEADEAAQAQHCKEVLEVGKQFGFDSSLLNTAAQVFQKPAAERGAFDGTCMGELKDAFNGNIAKLDEELAAGAPGKAARAAAVANAETAKQTAEAKQADLKEKAAAEKADKAAADGAVRAATKSLADFIPDIKSSGDALDKAKQALADFQAGPQKKFADLKTFKEGDFVPLKSYYQTIDGLRCDRAIIDACQKAVEGRGDGRVSVEDAKAVFEKMEDGGKVTRVERWTLRYCLEEFKWTDAAHDWINNALENVPQENPEKKARAGTSFYETVDGYKCDRGIMDAVREAVAGHGDGRVSLEDAKKVWEKAADGNKVTKAEKWTLRYCMSTFNWTRAGHDYTLEQLKTWVPAAPAPAPEPAAEAAA